MSKLPPIPPDVQDLLDDYLSGLLDEVRLRELDQRLRADAAFRRHFVRYCQVDTDLRLQALAHEAGERALRQVAEQPPAGPAPAVAGSTVKRSLRRRVLATLAAAALLLAAVGVGWLLAGKRGELPPGEGSVPEVAWLVNAQNCQWTDNGGPAGDMRPGKVLHMKSGLAELRFRNGARVVVQGPASLQLSSDSGVRLLYGRLTARIPETAKGFQVLSAQGKVVDLGTEFGMNVGEDGAVQVHVFEGEVEAHPTVPGPQGRGVVSLRQDQSARIDQRGLSFPKVGILPDRFVRAILPPSVVVPRTLALDFREEVPGTLPDANGLGTGLTHRLPGTGTALRPQDTNLRLNREGGRLELVTTDSDLHNQRLLPQGEYLGVRLSDLGFTGKEDFAVALAMPDIPALKGIGQFGLYAGTRSNCNIRGGLLRKGQVGTYTQFLVNNNGGPDTGLNMVGLLSTGDDLRITLQRTAGRYSLTIENETTGGTSTLTVRHPDFLDNERDLYVGLFGATPKSREPQTLLIREFKVTVQTLAPGPALPAPGDDR